MHTVRNTFISSFITAPLLSLALAACSSAGRPGVDEGPLVEDGETAVSSTESAVSGTYDAARGKKLADYALARWSGHSSGDRCLVGVATSVKSCGAFSTWTPAQGSAAEWDDYVKANPEVLERVGFVKMNYDLNHIPQGTIITWRPGQCGYDKKFGHIEIVVDTNSSRACSDFCGSIKKNCGQPSMYVPIGTGGGGTPNPGGSCSVQGDHKLHCANRGGAAMHASMSSSSAVVDHLRTTNSWFTCWGTGERHAGGNTTWYYTEGDDDGNLGWVPAVDLSTAGTFDQDPSAHGLARCGGSTTGGNTSCSVHSDGKLYCTNADGQAMYASANSSSSVVNHLRTTDSWFTCWGTGALHSGGNTTWYYTIGDDNGNWGWVPGSGLNTSEAFDENPSARGLRRCP